VRKENIDLKIKMFKNFYELQFLTIIIMETTLFVFSYEAKFEKNALEILNVLFMTLATKKPRNNFFFWFDILF